MGIFFFRLGLSLQSWKFPPIFPTKAQGQFPQDDGTIPTGSPDQFGLDRFWGWGDDLRGGKIRSRGLKVEMSKKKLKAGKKSLGNFSELSEQQSLDH